MRHSTNVNFSLLTRWGGGVCLNVSGVEVRGKNCRLGHGLWLMPKCPVCELVGGDPSHSPRAGECSAVLASVKPSSSFAGLC